MTKICVVTGTRAEYGLLYWLMQEILQHELCQLQLLVTGMHLAPEFGNTVAMIAQDGFYIDETVDMLLSGDTSVATAKSTGIGVIGCGDALKRLKPDILVVLGDRFEIFAAAQAAMFLNIPIAHIHGGEVTEGAIDESIRHCITKMSHLHFVAAQPYRRRVIQMGEQPSRVFRTGAPGLDNLVRLKLLSKSELAESLNIQLKERLYIVTFHPETLSERDPLDFLEELLDALDEIPTGHMIITKANADAGGRRINARLQEFANTHLKDVTLVSSLGQQKYLSALSVADLVIGNSSSGILEAPSAGTPTINIGERQKGRLRAPSVIDCACNKTEIKKAILKGLSAEFKKKAQQKKNPYGEAGGIAQDILTQLLSVDLQNLHVKSFYDLEFEERSKFATS